MDKFIFDVGDIVTYKEENLLGKKISRKAVICEVRDETVLLNPVSGNMFELPKSDVFQEKVNGGVVKPFPKDISLNFGKRYHRSNDSGYYVGIISGQHGYCLVVQRDGGGFICVKRHQRKVRNKKRDRSFKPDLSD